MEIVMSIPGKIGEYLVVPIEKQVGYLIYYNSNIGTLKDQLSQKLADKRNDLQREVEAARRNGQIVSSEVERWLTNADKLNEGLRRFLEEDVEANSTRVNGWCPNMKLRYSLSRKAKKKIEAIVELLGNVKFDRVSFPAPPLSSSIEGFKIFESRTSIMREVLESLRDDKIKMIALCGMGGTGKTTMAKEIAKRVINDNLFDEAAMAVVSQNPNLIDIQGQLANMLGLKLDTEGLPGKAQQLYSRIMNGKRILVILDDVWGGLNLEDIGIPHDGEQKLCKILLTSRSQQACSEMRTQKIFSIKVLSEEEAWNLFREIAGSSIDTPELRPIAEEVAKECGGLPVAIVTVGRALEAKSKDGWIAALHQLKKSIPRNIPGLHSKVYSSIELSYRYLESDEAKSCFLLCCLFPEEYDIPIEYLVRYGVSLRLFAKIDTVAEARYRVHALVQNLRRSFLLIDSEKKECVKMHVVVRDVAIEIASKDEHGFLVRCDDKMEEWPEEDAYERCVAISLVFKDLKKYPNGLEYPKLELLQLSSNFGGMKLQTPFLANFFEGMYVLKVLTLRGMSFESLPSSIQALQNLRTLNLHYCVLGDVSAIGALEKLEIVSFFGSQISELPREIGHLKHLRLLDLGECDCLKRIPRGVLSGLSQLEELYMRNSFEDWESMEGKQVRTNASLVELVPVSHRLMALDIQLPNANKLWPKDLIFKNLMTRFKISSKRSDYKMEVGVYLFQNSLALNSGAGDIANSSALRQLLEKSDVLELEGMKNLRNIVYELDQMGFPRLKDLSVSYCDDVEYLVDATSEMTPQATFPLLESLLLIGMDKLKEIYHSQLPERSFSSEQIPQRSIMYLQYGQPAQLASFGNLRSIQLCLCNHLKNVFSLSIARGLIQLQLLSISSCEMMEEIVAVGKSGEAATITEIVFPRVEILHFDELPNLQSFCLLSCDFDWPSLEEVIVVNCHKMSRFSLGSLNTPKLRSVQAQNGLQLWKGDLDTTIQHHFKSQDPLSIITKLDINSSDQLREILDIELCDSSFSELMSLRAISCDEKLNDLLSILVPRSHKLEGLEVNKCDYLKNLFSTFVAMELKQLKVLKIHWCNKLEEIISESEGEGTKINKIVLPQLKDLELVGLQLLEKFHSGSLTVEWPYLQSLKIESCLKMKTLAVIFPSKQTLTTIDGRYGEEPAVVKVEFPELQKLHLTSLVNFEEIWQGLLPAKTFPKLSELMVYNCGKLLVVMPFNSLPSFESLEKLTVQNCGLLEEVMHLEEPLAESSFVLSKLSELVLTQLPKLLNIFNRDFATIGIFQNLQVLKVKDCDCLENLFSPSTARCLEHIKEVEISNCSAMKEIFVKEKEGESNEPISFTHLNSIVLENLPSLQLFSSGSINFEFPSMVTLRITKCPEIKTFVSEFTSSNEIISEDVLRTPTYLFNEKVAVPYLEVLNLHKLDNLKQICNDYCLQNLTSLALNRCNNMRSLFSAFVARGLSKLNVLRISSCEMMEEIVAVGKLGEAATIAGIVFHQVKILDFKDLPNLQSFCLLSCDFDWPSLEEVIVVNCHKMSRFSVGLLNTPKLKSVQAQNGLQLWENDLDATIQHLYNSSQNQLSIITALDINSSDQLRQILDTKLLDSSFKQLKSLRAESCDEKWNDLLSKLLPRSHKLEGLEVNKFDYLKNLFSTSEAMELKQLKVLKIHWCNKLEEIISESEGRRRRIISEEETKINKIVLPQLKDLELVGLPHLEKFHSGSLTVEWQCLRSLKIESCPKMKTLTVIFPSMQTLTTIDGRYREEPAIVKVKFPELQKLHLISLRNFEEIWQGLLPAKPFPKLSELTVDTCGKLLYVVPFNSLPSFESLEKLIVKNCGSLKEVIHLEEPNMVKPLAESSVLSKLSELVLTQLPKLVHIFNGDFAKITDFQNLQVLKVKDCNCLTNLFSPSVARCLEHIKEVEISDCRVMEEIFVNEKEGEINETISFTHLNSIVLENLPSLQTFSSGSISYDFSSLVTLRIANCPKIKTFVSGYIGMNNSQVTAPHFFTEEVAFPKMQKLHLYYFDHLEGIWHDNFPVSSPSELRLLEIDSCCKLVKVIPSSLLRELHNLEKLFVERCDSLQVLFDFESGIGEVLLSQLSELVFTYLPRMVHMWNKEPASGISVFGNLKSLQVIHCNDLEKLFSPSTAKNLEQLELLKLYGCQKMKEVISDEKEDVKDITFPKLKCLILKHLPNLTSFTTFSPDDSSVRWDSLKMVRVKEIPKMETFAPGFHIITPNLKAIYVTHVGKCWLGDLNATIKLLYDKNGTQSSEDLGEVQHGTQSVVVAESSSKASTSTSHEITPEPSGATSLEIVQMSSVGDTAANIVEFLWNKFSDSLEDAESESSALSLISKFKNIKKDMKMETLERICSSNATDTLDLLYDLNGLLAECRIFENQLDQSLSHFVQLKKFLFRMKVKPQLTRISEGFKQMVKEVEQKMGGEPKGKSVQSRYFETIRHTSPKVDVFEIIEFDVHVEKVKSLLWGNRDDDIGFTAIGIVGMGGVGKTALVQKIFNSPCDTIQKEFSKKVWICLSDVVDEEIDVEVKIVKCILDGLGRDTDEETTDFGIVELLEKLKHYLSGERYLIVLDDVWHTHNLFNLKYLGERKEECFWHWLPKDNKYCYGKVIVTSRKNKVAEDMVGEKNLVHLEPSLSRKSCLKIFDNTIYKDWRITSDHHGLAELKDGIMDKFRGLPLAAKDLAKIFGNLIGPSLDIPQLDFPPGE